MPSDAIPAPVAAFLSKYIVSLEQLEVLIALSREPERSWSAAEVFAALQTNQVSIANRLEGFSGIGLVRQEEGTPRRYRYAPESPELAQIVADVTEFYKVRPVRTIEAIFNREREAARHFADAFRFRKD